MAWWIPTSWFEDLGTANRVSTYEFKFEKNYSGHPLYYPSVSCKVELADGTTIVESCTGNEMRKDEMYPALYPQIEYDLTEKLAASIRQKYPKAA